jgi:hypothetical protein
MIDMIANRFSQKEVLAIIQQRKEMQREKIRDAREHVAFAASLKTTV